MLVRRRLAMPEQVLHEPLLRRETVHELLRADQVLDQARQQADELLQAAQDQCRHYLQSAQAAFWEQANRQLQAFADDNAALQHEVLASLDRLLGQALGRLLDDTDLTQRIRALLGNLSDSPAAHATATLSCHPQQAQAVRAWLDDSSLAGLWSVRESPQVALQALRLSHAQGALEIDWDALRRSLTGQSAADAAAHSQLHPHQQGDQA
ncbi:type III secretion protein L [Pseudomonas flavescens]|uniref:Type III secretion protein L n=1 Tax=Phytopseudomonas flavescens TaxID=29435 RepID=A0A1G8DLY5_9GAMM|nr:type III secretion system stator protein SctL [Pseudomonas flavescens]SDH58489.1 type III secretion protein L [Pseudomonas flavescens]